jgi:hypothetical protein
MKQSTLAVTSILTLAVFGTFIVTNAQGSIFGSSSNSTAAASQVYVPGSYTKLLLSAFGFYSSTSSTPGNTGTNVSATTNTNTQMVTNTNVTLAHVSFRPMESGLTSAQVSMYKAGQDGEYYNQDQIMSDKLSKLEASQPIPTAESYQAQTAARNASIATLRNTLANATTSVVNVPASQYIGLPCTYAGCFMGSDPMNTTKTCKNEVTFEAAKRIADMNQLTQAQILALFDPSMLKVRLGGTNTIFSRVDARYYANAAAYPISNLYIFDLCLDPNYVSNVPAGYDKAAIISMNVPSTKLMVLPPSTQSSANIPGNTQPRTFTLLSNTYTSGSTTVTIFQINDIQKLSANEIPFMTGGPVTTKLASMGYRMATREEALVIQSTAGDDANGVKLLGVRAGGMAVYVGLSSMCPGKICVANMGLIYNGDKVMGVKM